MDGTARRCHSPGQLKFEIFKLGMESSKNGRKAFENGPKRFESDPKPSETLQKRSKNVRHCLKTVRNQPKRSENEVDANPVCRTAGVTPCSFDRFFQSPISTYPISHKTKNWRSESHKTKTKGDPGPTKRQKLGDPGPTKPKKLAMRAPQNEKNWRSGPLKTKN